MNKAYSSSEEHRLIHENRWSFEGKYTTNTLTQQILRKKTDNWQTKTADSSEEKDEWLQVHLFELQNIIRKQAVIYFICRIPFRKTFESCNSARHGMSDFGT
jgi:hypothetical protein